MFKKITIYILFLVFFLMPSFVFAKDKVDIYLFYANGCPHCEKEKIFLDELLQDEKYNEVVLKDYEVSGSSDNLAILQKMAKEYNFAANSVPITVIGEEVINGFGSAETTGVEIVSMLNKLIEENAPISDDGSKRIHLPIFGDVDLHSVSLPALTVMLGFLDGFNPCAMWALLFLISMLLGMENKRRMWILGTVFIVASAFIYFLFMAAWLNFILFIGFVFWVRIIIGLVALGGGIFSLKKFRDKRTGCEVTGTKKRQKTFAKIKNIVYKKNFLLSLVGIIILAFTVNLVELICSAGLPAVYSQVLALNDLTTVQHYGYILLYIFFFMLDDLVIFFIAMFTLKLTGISTKYSKWSSLIGGILMVIIGLLLIFKYELLMFG